jgi:hypothetical protein
MIMTMLLVATAAQLTSSEVFSASSFFFVFLVILLPPAYRPAASASDLKSHLRYPVPSYAARRLRSARQLLNLQLARGVLGHQRGGQERAQKPDAEGGGKQFKAKEIFHSPFCM